MIRTYLIDEAPYGERCPQNDNHRENTISTQLACAHAYIILLVSTASPHFRVITVPQWSVGRWAATVQNDQNSTETNHRWSSHLHPAATAGALDTRSRPFPCPWCICMSCSSQNLQNSLCPSRGLVAVCARTCRRTHVQLAPIMNTCIVIPCRRGTKVAQNPGRFARGIIFPVGRRSASGHPKNLDSIHTIVLATSARPMRSG